MSHDNLIRSNVRKAFRLLKDIAEEVTLVQGTSHSYDFATDAATIATKSATVKAIFIRAKTTASKDTETKLATFIVQTEDVKDPDKYTTITTKAGIVWSVVPPCTIDNYLTELSVTRKP